MLPRQMLLRKQRRLRTSDYLPRREKERQVEPRGDHCGAFFEFWTQIQTQGILCRAVPNSTNRLLALTYIQSGRRDSNSRHPACRRSCCDFPWDYRVFLELGTYL